LLGRRARPGRVGRLGERRDRPLAVTSPIPDAGAPSARAGSAPDAPTATSAPATAADPAGSQDARAILSAARAAVDPELRRAIGSLPGAMRRVALHHFGWECVPLRAGASPGAQEQSVAGHEGAADVLAPPGGRAGKAIRPALVFAAVSA